MTMYVVYEHKVFGRRAVKTGFSAGGCFLTLLWALFHKMWVLAAILFIWASIATSMHNILSNISKGDPVGILIGQFIFYHLPAALIFGFLGNRFIKSKLERQGYEKVNEIEARSFHVATTNSQMIKMSREDYIFVWF